VVDLLGGRAVHARGGRREVYQPVQSRLLGDGETGDAAALARAYRRSGVAEIYLADLDAIAAGPVTADAVAAIGAEWVDAGVRDLERAEQLLTYGTQHIVLALETLSSWALVEQVVAVAGPARTAFSLDLRGGVPLGLLGGDPVALARQAADLGVSALIVLDLARVGGSAGIDWALVAAIRGAVPHVELVAGGGIRDAQDVDEAARVGCDGVLLGTALHTGSLLAPKFAIGARFS